MARKQQILFVSHAASRSGAPILFLEIIKKFRQQTTIPFQIIVLEDGPLLADFKQAGETFLWKKKPVHPAGTGFRLLISIVTKKINQFIRERYIRFRVRKSSLVFFNTMGNRSLYQKMLFLKCGYVCYVHELEAAIQLLTNPPSRQAIMSHTKIFFAVSKAVADNLINNHQVDKEKIRLSYASIAHTHREKQEYGDFVRAFKNKLPDNAVIIGVIGPDEWRKGFDLFLPLITLFLRQYKDLPVVFIWKGFKENSESSFYNRYDIKKFKLGNQVLIFPHGSDSQEYMACLDIHLLLSREDPYPLVVQEAAAFGIPTISFSDAGGSTEFIETDSGISVPYGDLLQMAAAIYSLVADPATRHSMGEAAKEKVRKRHDQEKIITEMIEVVTHI